MHAVNNPISRIIYLWKNKKNRDSKMTLMLYVCLYLIIAVDIFYEWFFYFESKTMFIINSVCLVLNITIYILYELKQKKIGIQLLISELFIFLILGTIFTGWSYGFQQYLFGMICVVFLPYYISDYLKVPKKMVFISGFTFIVSYYILDYICNYTALIPGIESTILTARTIHAINSFISICAVSSFCGISTKLSTEDKKKLKRKADFDELTQIYNRYGLNQILDTLRKDKSQFYLAIADIDYFKKVNDVYGHDIGDKVLKNVAKQLVKRINQKISVGRWGGEEFLIISDSSLTHREFKNILEEIRRYYENNPIVVKNKKINITLSFGAAKHNMYSSIEHTIKNADNNLYKAKESGRNKIVG